MHAHKRVRTRVHVARRVGVAVFALATTIGATPPAHASTITRAADAGAMQAVMPKKSRRHWGRFWGWSRPVAVTQHTPNAIQIVLAVARAQLGKPYVYGSAGPNSFDCSGLTKFVWSKAGVALPHNAAAQYDIVHHIALTDARPGDLVFFGYRGGIGHVGLYIGNGKMIHAPYSGTSVQVAPLQSDLVGVGRVAHR
jgi:cell wall-associated NlpC family hydrolase